MITLKSWHPYARTYACVHGLPRQAGDVRILQYESQPNTKLLQCYPTV